MKNVLFLFCFLSLGLGLSAKEIKIGNKKVVRSVKDVLKAGKIKTSKTCLDEYVKRNRQLWKKMGFGALKTLGGSAGTGAGVGVVGGAAAGATMLGGAEGALWVAILGGGAGGFIGLAIGGVALVGYEGTQIARFVKNNQIIRVIANSRDQLHDGKHLKRFRKKYFRKFPKDKRHLNANQFSAAIVDIDTSGILCDGSLVQSRGMRKLMKKGKKKLSEKELNDPKNLKYLLATKSEIFKFVHSLVEKKSKK
ncbi:hypothetical protein OAK75_09850 [Bacteriovoracales bacterium]|nr:hypothetical protein [Bacteriovoracales bacterium]